MALSDTACKYVKPKQKPYKLADEKRYVSTHWKTYNRLMVKHLAYSNNVYARMLTILKRMAARFDRIQRQ